MTLKAVQWQRWLQWHGQRSLALGFWWWGRWWWGGGGGRWRWGLLIIRMNVIFANCHLRSLIIFSLARHCASDSRSFLTMIILHSDNNVHDYRDIHQNALEDDHWSWQYIACWAPRKLSESRQDSLELESPVKTNIATNTIYKFAKLKQMCPSNNIYAPLEPDFAREKETRPVALSGSN